MFLEEISKNQFEEVMDNLLGETIWVDIKTDCIFISHLFEKFEFLSFKNGKYQFGHLEYLAEKEHENFIIKQKDILNISRDNYATTLNAEQIIVVLKDFSQLIIEYNC